MKYESILNVWGKNKVPNGEHWEVFGRQKTGDFSTHILTCDTPEFQFEVLHDLSGGLSTEEVLKYWSEPLTIETKKKFGS